MKTAIANSPVCERAKRRAKELAATSDVRLTPPPLRVVNAPERTRTGKLNTSTDNRVPLPGSTIVREYKGELVEVRVLTKGFDYDGKVYRSLSGVAKVAISRRSQNRSATSQRRWHWRDLLLPRRALLLAPCCASCCAISRPSYPAPPTPGCA
ncbi:MAG TPA: DUF2924 domain-containing protein [Planctomycetota bacterium]|nr:DUF2924 domain-containing protein [Planctomycetota bacterium]